MGQQQGLDEIAGMITAAWMDALVISDGRQLWRDLAPHLEGRPGMLLRDWYLAWMLGSCRKLLDVRRDVSSLQRALISLERVVPDLDVDTIAGLWIRQGTAVEGTLVRDDVTDAIVELTGGRNQVHRADVSADRETLERDHAAVVKLAHQFLHRQLHPDPVTVSETDVDRLLDDVLAIARRWNRLTRGSGLSDVSPGPASAPLVTALRLFDWQEYVQSLAGAERNLGPWAAPAAYERLEREVTIEFVWPTDER